VSSVYTISDFALVVVEDAQLEGRIHSREEGLALIRKTASD